MKNVRKNHTQVLTSTVFYQQFHNVEMSITYGVVKSRRLFLVFSIQFLSVFQRLYVLTDNVDLSVASCLKLKKNNEKKKK